LQKICVVWGSAVGAAIFFAIVVTGFFRFIFNLEEKPAMLFVFCPVGLGLVIYWIRKLPARLCKAGMIVEDPRKFGPWLKD
jgi:hypothetical protein